MSIRIEVLGVPVVQGNHSKNSAGAVYETTKGHRPWRDAVAWAAREARQRSGIVAGPVCVEIIFTMPKPKSAPKRKRTWPDRKPDIDKLCRTVLDGITIGGLIEDDARVTDLWALKCFPGESVDGLDVPGAVIRVRMASE